jgi:hypothetical protein
MLYSVVLVGIFSCFAMDIWQQLIKALFSFPASNWGLVGRWFLTFVKSKNPIVLDIESKDSFKNEKIVGWTLHYCIGIIYAFVFWTLAYSMEILSTTLLDGILFGAISVVVPWFFFLPCMGKGILALNSAKPVLVCMLAFFTHIVFGVAIALLFNVF